MLPVWTEVSHTKQQLACTALERKSRLNAILSQM